MVLSPTTLSKFRAGPRSLRGLRLIRTQLQDRPLSQEDLTDLGYLRLDLIGILSVSQNGTPGTLYLAHLLPQNETGRLCEVLKPTPLQECPIVFDRFIKDLEVDLQEALKHHAVTSGSESAILVSASSHGRAEQEERLAELADLAASVGVTVFEIGRAHV